MSVGNIINGLLKSKISGAPFYSHYYITRRCLYRCKMCSIWKNGDKKEEPSLEIIDKIASRMSEMNVSNVVFTGGEPFLRPDLHDIVKIFKDKGLSVRLQTTGASYIKDAMLEKVINAGVQHITISLDTLDSKKQDEICQSKDLWESAVRAIKLSVELLPRGVVVANTVVSKMNIEELPKIVEFITSIGAYSSLVPVHLTDNPEERNPIRCYEDAFILRETDIPTVERVYKDIFRMKKEGYKIGSSSKFLHDSFSTILTRNQKWSCDAGKYYFVIYPGGDVAICDDYPPNWNILDPYFIENFYGDKSRKIISELIENCRGCIYGCWRETSYLLHHPGVLLEQGKNFGRRILFGMKKTG
jgi:MoaA/NifB/PqqE/SkfB family radical SAM enzyme